MAAPFTPSARTRGSAAVAAPAPVQKRARVREALERENDVLLQTYPALQLALPDPALPMSKREWEKAAWHCRRLCRCVMDLEETGDRFPCHNYLLEIYGNFLEKHAMYRELVPDPAAAITNVEWVASEIDAFFLLDRISKHVLTEIRSDWGNICTRWHILMNKRHLRGMWKKHFLWLLCHVYVCFLATIFRR